MKSTNSDVFLAISNKKLSPSLSPSPSPSHVHEVVCSTFSVLFRLLLIFQFFVLILSLLLLFFSFFVHFHFQFHIHSQELALSVCRSIRVSVVQSITGVNFQDLVQRELTMVSFAYFSRSPEILFERSMHATLL